MTHIDGKPRVLVLLTALGLLVSAVAVAACSPAPSIESPSPAPSLPPDSPLPTPTSDLAVSPLEIPPEIPVPQEGKAAVSGLLYTITSKAPIPGTTFYLTPALGEDKRPPNVLSGAQTEAGDIRGTSDDEGWIALDNVPPGDYYLAVWAPYDWLIAGNSEVDLTPRLITVEAGQQLDLDVLHVEWP
ncbi:carboxypeptidase-like regulatory domain-containing protein [Chloroflexota bacterium]